MSNLNDRKIYLDDPNVGDLELKYIQQAIQNNEIVTGSFIQKFEEKMADWLGIKKENCVACSSGTAALHMALKVLNIGPGDEVILPAITFIATANVIKYVGATPVFVDIDPDTWNIDINKIQEKITSKTKAIICVHLYGNPCDINALKNICYNNKLYLIEDACESLGATYNNQQTGTFGDIGCFSFNGNKIITGAGGGMIVANNKEYADRARYLINQAKPDFIEIGYNYRISNIQAGMLLGQMDKLENFLYMKSEISSIYRSILGLNENIKFQTQENQSFPSYWMTTIKINTRKIGKTIPQIQEKLKEKGIPTRRIFESITNFKPYLQYWYWNNSYDLWENGICLPSSTKNTYESIEYVAETLLEAINE
jgi:perosamine synthetase